jgi:hypothetical protein
VCPGSPAIDAGKPTGCRDTHGDLLLTDQRGFGWYPGDLDEVAVWTRALSVQPESDPSST